MSAIPESIHQLVQEAEKSVVGYPDIIFRVFSSEAMHHEQKEMNK
jgi:hypothetical protein